MRNHEKGGGAAIKKFFSKIPWKTVWNIAKPLITVFMVWFIFKGTDWSRIWIGLQKVDLLLYLTALVFFNVVLMVLYVWRWDVVLKENGIVIPFFSLMRIQFIGVMAQTFMPSTFGADVVKFAMVNKKGRGAETLNSLFLGRVMGIVALVLLAVPATFLFYIKDAGTIRIILIAVMAATVIGLFFARYPFFDINRLMKIRWMEKPGKFLKNLKNNMTFRLLVPMFLISVLIQVFGGVSLYFFMTTAGIAVPFGKVFFIAPLISAVTMLIPAMLGIGPREAGMLYFFPIEIGGKEMLGVLSVIINAAILIQVLAGLFFWIFMPKNIGQESSLSKKTGK